MYNIQTAVGNKAKHIGECDDAVVQSARKLVSVTMMEQNLLNEFMGGGDITMKHSRSRMS